MMTSVRLRLILSAAMVAAGCGDLRMSNDQVITLEVLGDGTFLWNGAHLSDAQVIRSRFQAIAAQSPQPQIHLKANRDAGYEAVADLLREAQRDGVHKIGFVGTEAP